MVIRRVLFPQKESGERVSCGVQAAAQVRTPADETEKGPPAEHGDRADVVGHDTRSQDAALSVPVDWRLLMRGLLALLMWTVAVFGVCWPADATQATREERIAIYVGPQTRDGFIDVDQGILDSIKDIQNEFRSSRQFQVVRTSDEATLVLVVVGRRIAGSSGGVGVPIGFGMSVMIPVKRRAIDTVLRVGSYEKATTSEDDDRDSWRAAAKQVVKDVTAWVEANRSSLVKAKPPV